MYACVLDDMTTGGTVATRTPCGDGGEFPTGPTTSQGLYARVLDDMTAGGTANTYAAFQEYTRAGTPPHVYAVPQTDTFTGRHEGRSACVQDRWYRGSPGKRPRPAGTRGRPRRTKGPTRLVLPFPQPEPAPAAPELPPEADRLAAPATVLERDAAEVWRDAVAVGDDDTLKRGKVRKQIGRTLRGAGLYLFVASSMHAAKSAKKAKGRAAAHWKTVEEAGRARRSVGAHYPDCLPAVDAALRHALGQPRTVAREGWKGGRGDATERGDRGRAVTAWRCALSMSS